MTMMRFHPWKKSRKWKVKMALKVNQQIKILTLILYPESLKIHSMKKLGPFLILFPLAVAAQKEIKPRVSKAEASLQKGTFHEAKSIIDPTRANQEYMVDKKGQPSNNASKASYL